MASIGRKLNESNESIEWIEQTDKQIGDVARAFSLSLYFLGFISSLRDSSWVGKRIEDLEDIGLWSMSIKTTDSGQEPWWLILNHSS